MYSLLPLPLGDQEDYRASKHRTDIPSSNPIPAWAAPIAPRMPTQNTALLVTKSSSHLGEGEGGGGRYKIKQATEMK